jgi:hypothetical protein
MPAEFAMRKWRLGSRSSGDVKTAFRVTVAPDALA